jgi:zinc/manganese transport system substrate-binding protein
MLGRALIALLVAVALLAVGCSGDDADDDRPLVVVTTTILGDVVANVVGDGATVEVLMPAGADPHDYIPSSQQVARIHQADLVVVNGLGLEAGLSDVLESAVADGANVIEIAPHLDPLPFGGGDELDPHMWMDPLRMKVAASAIAEALFLIDGDDSWHAGEAAYAAELDAAHQQIETLLAQVPVEQRKLVTNHDSLGYLADRYGFVVIGTVIPGGSSLGNPSSAQLAELVATVERENVPAIFAETTEAQDLAEAVAAEVGHDVAVVVLLTGSLAEEGSPGDTLIGMLLIDAERIAEALG